MKIAVTFLAFLTLSLSAIPCCVLTDDCREETHHICDDAPDESDHDPCAACSPFFTCGNCSGFVFPQQEYPCPFVEKGRTDLILFTPNLISYVFYTSLLKPPRV